jgi:integrase
VSAIRDRLVLALRGHPLPERVFSTPTEHAVGDGAFRNNVWTPILRRAGLSYRKPHTLRHTYATLLIDDGVPLTYVQHQLGHHSAGFTLKVYGHLLPRADRRAVNALDDAPAAPIRNPGATDSKQDNTSTRDDTPPQVNAPDRIRAPRSGSRAARRRAR